LFPVRVGGEGGVVVVATIPRFTAPFRVQRIFLGLRAAEEDTGGSRHRRHLPWLFITGKNIYWTPTSFGFLPFLNTRNAN